MGITVVLYGSALWRLLQQNLRAHLLASLRQMGAKLRVVAQLRRVEWKNLSDIQTLSYSTSY